ncbi:uncharacterized protein LOC123665157 [Melitaea cinxia]|uniref:uncharacterized protein LOC123665157 n=1 Tax=Melitaea cinxia TaxID=113334 RepID=UPI001E273E18|nr:uncharacterized protein LOC123665157 [Melitaea cinxia]
METTHQDLKNSNTFAKQRTSNVDKLLSNEKLAVSTWQGLNNDMCLLCDEPFGVVIRHIKSFDHLVNLLQSETISENGNCYRKQSANRFYCFKCFKVYDKDDLDAHWTECHQNSQKISEEKTNEENMKKALMKSQTKSTETNVLKRTRNKYFNFEMENKAICLRCKEEVDLNYEAIDGHIKIHEKLQNIDLERPLIDKGKRRAELADYGRNNFITLNQGGSKSYCTLCCVYMSPHIKNAKDHVGGSLHRGHLELRGLIQKQKHDIFPVQLIPHRYFVKVLQGPQIINGVSVVCINNDICVTLLSYMLISANYNFNDDILKCYGCNILINSSDFKIHIKSEEHKANVWKCKVLLISVKCVDEYIREVRPNLYHCGYCNCIFPFWENLMKHLKSLLHIEMRISKPKFTGGIMMRQKY